MGFSATYPVRGLLRMDLGRGKSSCCYGAKQERSSPFFLTSSVAATAGINMASCATGALDSSAGVLVPAAVKEALGVGAAGRRHVH